MLKLISFKRILSTNIIKIVAIIFIVLYGAWWGYSLYKFMWYKPSAKKQQALIAEFKNKLKQDKIDVSKIDNVSVIYEPKTDDYTYLVKVSNEPYTYECSFDNYKKPSQKELLCQIQEILTGKTTIIPTLTEKEAENPNAQKIYDQKYKQAYTKLVKGLLLEKYLMKSL